MKSLFVGRLLAGALVASCALAAVAPNAATAIEPLIRALEAEEVQAVLTHDAATLERLWDKDFVVHNPEGKIVPAGASVRDRPVFQRPRVAFVRKVESVVVNETLAISMGSESVTMPGESSKPSQVVERRYTNVWRLKDGVWKLVARHANPVRGRE